MDLFTDQHVTYDGLSPLILSEPGGLTRFDGDLIVKVLRNRAGFYKDARDVFPGHSFTCRF